MITKREAAIISAYTGYCIGDFSETHKYIEEILERPVWTHEMARTKLWEEIRAKAKPDFMKLEVEYD